MAKGIKQKKGNTGLLTGEIFGMALILFAVLAFLCLVAGDIVYPVGGIIRGFILGAFGYYAFVVVCLLVIIGLKLLIAKPLMKKQARINFWLLNVMLFSVFAILHVAIFVNASNSFSEGVSQAYLNGQATLKTSTAFGAFGSICLYPILLVLNKIGAYIAFGLIVAVCVFAIIRRIFSGFSKSEKEPKPPRSAKPKNNNQDEGFANNYANQNLQDQKPAQLENAEFSRPGLFIASSSTFASEAKSQKGKKKNNSNKNSQNYSLVFNRNNVASVNGNGFSPARSYTQTYVDDLDKKVEYITQPRPYNLDNLGQSPMNAKNPNAYSQDRRDYSVQRGVDGNDVARDIYTINDREALRSASDRNSINSYEKQGAYSDRRMSDGFVDVQSFDNKDSSSSLISEDYGATDIQRDDFVPRANDRFSQIDFSAKDRLESQPAKESVPVSTEESLRKVYNPLRADKVIEDTPSDNYIESVISEREITRASGDRVANIQSQSESLTNQDNTSSNRLNSPTTIRNAVQNVAPVVPQSQMGGVRQVTINEVVNQAKKEKPEKVEKVEKPNPFDLMPANYRYKAPPINLLNAYAQNREEIEADKEKQLQRAEAIVTTLKYKNIDAKVEDIIYGPSVTRFVISIPQGVPAKMVLQAQSDLQLWLGAASDIRILVPIYGTTKIGIEVPNEKTSLVGLRDIIMSKKFKEIKDNTLTFALGKDIVGNPIFLNIMDMPHLIVAGATGTGKSVCLNTMLISLLYRYSPEDLRLIIVDPKIVEFDVYRGLPHLLFDEIFGNDGKALAMLEWACIEMDRRYNIFKDKGVRKIQEYNDRIDPATEKKMPAIIILIDEFADLMMTANDKKKIQNYVGRLAQKARAAGISLIFATQRPSADVIDGSIKTNFPARICFKTSSTTDSLVVIGEGGAEKLLGKGDVMYKMPSMPNIDRAQGSFISDDEVKAVVKYVRDNNKTYYDEKALELINNTKFSANDDDEERAVSGQGENIDPNAIEDVYLRALRLVIMTKNVSKTSLQSKLSIGYPKAAKIIDWMEEQGFVSTTLDGKTRTIYITRETYEERFGEFVESYKPQ